MDLVAHCTCWHISDNQNCYFSLIVMFLPNSERKEGSSKNTRAIFCFRTHCTWCLCVCVCVCCSMWLTASNSWRSKTVANLQSGTSGDITRAQDTISPKLFRNDVLQNTLNDVAPNTQSCGVFYLEHTGSFIIHVAWNVFRACTTSERLTVNLPTDWKGCVLF